MALEWQPVIVAGIGFAGSIIVAWIGFRAAIKAAKDSSSAAIEAAKVTADANMKQVLCMKAHDAIAAAIKVLTHRHDICNALLKFTVDNSTEERVRLNVGLFFALSQKFSETASLDLETMSVLPYVRSKLPVRSNCEAQDLDVIVKFDSLCKKINYNLMVRGSTELLPEEIGDFSMGLKAVKEPFAREKEIIERTLDVLYAELRRIEKECVHEKQEPHHRSPLTFT